MSGTVLVDVDGTLGRQLDHTLTVAAANGVDHDATHEDITEWDATVPGTDYHIGDLIVKMEEEYPEEYVLNMPVVSGAKSALGDLQEAGWTVVICTHRSPDSHPYTAQWVEANDIPHDAYAHDVPENKAAMQGDVLIDDYHGNISDAARAGMHGVLFESPYSLTEQVSGYSNVSVVQSWAEAADALRDR